MSNEKSRRMELVAEIKTALERQARGGMVDAEWLADRIDELEWINRQMEKAGLIPA